MDRERERVVVDVGIGVPVLQVGGIRHEGIRRHEPSEIGVVDAGVHVDEAEAGEHFVAGEAAGSGGRDRATVRIGAVSVAALAPGVVAEALGHRAAGIGDDSDGAEMIGDEVAPRHRAGGDHLVPLRHHVAVGHDVIAPGGGGRAHQLLAHRAHGVQIERGQAWRHLTVDQLSIVPLQFICAASRMAPSN